MQDYTDLNGYLEFHHVRSIIYYLDAFGWNVKGAEIEFLFISGSIREPVKRNQKTEYDIPLQLYN
jgi:hypothetical protein